MDSFFVGKNRAQKKNRNEHKVCRNFQHNKCSFGDDCRFSHGTKRPRAVPAAVKKKMNRVCKNHLNGGCKWGDRCKFTHGTATKKQQQDKHRRAATRRNDDEGVRHRDPGPAPASSSEDEYDRPATGRRRDPGPAPGDFPSDVSSSDDDEYDRPATRRRRDPGPAPPSSEEDVDEEEEEEEEENNHVARLEAAAALSAAMPIRSDDDSDSDSSDDSDDSASDSDDDQIMGARLSKRRMTGSKGIGMHRNTHNSTTQYGKYDKYDKDDDRSGEEYAEQEDDSDDEMNRQRKKQKTSSSNKKSRHAPAIMSSKQAVTRYRVVVPDSEVSHIRKRDPRFDNLSGKLNRGHWETAYTFIDEYKQSELEEMKRAAKNQKNNEEGVARRQQIEQDLSKEQNRVNERRQWKQERSIVQEHRRKERKAIADGKKTTPYHLSRQGLKKAKLEKQFVDLKKKGKLDKYMEKRRKKNAMKDRRRMPRNFSQ